MPIRQVQPNYVPNYAEYLLQGLGVYDKLTDIQERSAKSEKEAAITQAIQSGDEDTIARLDPNLYAKRRANELAQKRLTMDESKVTSEESLRKKAENAKIAALGMYKASLEPSLEKKSKILEETDMRLEKNEVDYDLRSPFIEIGRLYETGKGAEGNQVINSELAAIKASGLIEFPEPKDTRTELQKNVPFVSETLGVTAGEAFNLLKQGKYTVIESINPDGTITRVIQGQGAVPEMTARTQGELEKKILNIDERNILIQKIKGIDWSKHQDIFGKGREVALSWKAAVPQLFGDLDTEQRKFLEDAQSLEGFVGQIADSYRHDITGSQAGMVEINRIEKRILSRAFDPVRFGQALKDLETLDAERKGIYQRSLTSGMKSGSQQHLDKFNLQWANRLGPDQTFQRYKELTETRGYSDADALEYLSENRHNVDKIRESLGFPPVDRK